MPMCWRSSTRLSLPWPSSRGRLLARRSAPGWIPRSSHPLLLVGVLPLLQFAVEPPLRPLPLLRSPLSLPSAPLPWPVTPLPPLHPCPRLVPRVQHPWLLPRLMPRMPPALLLNPPLFRGHRPNALLPPSPPLSALCPVPMVCRGSRLPVPCVPVTRRAGPLAGSTSLGTPPLSGSSPTLFPPLPPPLSTPPCFHSHLRNGSRPVRTARGTPWTHLIVDSTSAASISRRSPLTPALSHLVPLSRLSPHLVPVCYITFLGPMPLLRYLVPFTTPLTYPPFAEVGRCYVE